MDLFGKFQARYLELKGLKVINHLRQTKWSINTNGNTSNAKSIAQQIADGEYNRGTFIDGESVQSPNILGGNLVGSTFIAANTSRIPVNHDITGVKRMLINQDGITSKNEYNKLNGIQVNSDGFSSIEFYYLDDYRGELSQAGGTIYLKGDQD